MTTTIKTMGRLGILSLVAFNLLLGVSTAAGKEPTFTTIDPPGSMFSWAVESNPAGQIVGAYFTDTFHSYLLSKGEFTTIDPPGAILENGAEGINPAGEIVGVYLDASEVGHGFLSSKGEFTTIDAPGAVYTRANGITPGGEIGGSTVIRVRATAFY